MLGYELKICVITKDEYEKLKDDAGKLYDYVLSADFKYYESYCDFDEIEIDEEKLVDSEEFFGDGIPEQYDYSDVNIEKNLKDGECLIGYLKSGKGGFEFAEDIDADINDCDYFLYQNIEMNYNGGYFDINKIVVAAIDGELFDVKFEVEVEKDIEHFIITDGKYKVIN